MRRDVKTKGRDAYTVRKREYGTPSSVVESAVVSRPSRICDRCDCESAPGAVRTVFALTVVFVLRWAADMPYMCIVYYI